MSVRVFEAIVSLWDANSLGDTFGGGIHFRKAPASTSFPYVVMVPVSAARSGRTSASKYIDQRVQLSVFYKAADSVDPVSQLGTLMRTLDPVMDDAELSIPASEGHVFSLDAESEMVHEDPAPDVYHGTLNYMVRRRKPS